MKIFILSLPRSGSTALQRNLSQILKINTRPETWLAPFLSNFEPTSLDIHETGGHNLKYIAKNTKDFDAKRTQLIRFAFELWHESSCFIEKTPRNYFYLNMIQQAFPDAYYIVLTRDPINQLQSCVQTFKSNRLKLNTFKNDYKHGAQILDQFLIDTNCKAIHVTFEELEVDKLATVNNILNFLGQEEITTLPTRLNKLEGGLGDPMQSDNINHISPTKKMSLFRYLVFCGIKRGMPDLYHGRAATPVELCFNPKQNLLDMANLCMSTVDGIVRKPMKNFLYGKKKYY
ncbi:sulfotransferase [Planktomarina temperata]|nr:sulfotransferase [Planktomarina temperata]